MPEPTTVVAPAEVEAGWGDKKIRIRGSDWMGLINMVAIGIMLYGGWQHVEAAKDGSKAIAEAIKESNGTQREMVNAQREANCLNRLTPQEKVRIENIEFCRQLGRGR